MCEQCRLQLKDVNMQLGPLDRAILDLQQNLDNADTELERRRQEVDQAREVKEQMEKKERDLDIKLNSLVEEKRECDKLLELANDSGEDDLDELFSRRAEIRRDIVRLEVELEDLTHKLETQQQDVLGLEVQQRKVYPRFVETFRDALDHAGIEHDLACDLIDITDPDWQLAVESILGRDRFTVLVAADDQLRARQLAQ